MPRFVGLTGFFPACPRKVDELARDLLNKHNGMSSGRKTRGGKERTSMEFQHIIYQKKRPAAYILLNHPEKRNPISPETHRELRKAFDLCDEDDQVRVVVIRGSGGNFSAGGDLNVMKARIDAGVRGTQTVCRLGAETNLRLREVRKPVIAWLEGAVAGAGISLALACDFQIVSESSKCVFAFVNIGFVPDSGAAMFGTRAVGTTRAADLFLSGRPFTGREAADWGLFTEAVPAEELEARVEEYVKKYSRGPTAAYAEIKALINRAQYGGYADLMSAEIAGQGRCELTQDHKEAVTAFLSKRKPDFQGR